VDVAAYVDAELDRRFPGRSLRLAANAEDLRLAWGAVERAWTGAVDRALTMPAGAVDVSVAGEWSFAQTLRHLVLATDCWLRGAIQRHEQPFHEIGQVFTGAEEMGFDTSIFRDEPPSHDEVLAVRAERQQMVTDFLATATPELLAEERSDPWGGGGDGAGDAWRPTVGDCLRTILEEEWAHLRYVRRDLALLG